MYSNVTGYLSKTINSIYQAVKVVKDDCGSNNGLDGSIVTKKNFKFFNKRLIIKNGKVREIEKSDIGTKFILRDPTYCKAKGGYCRVCTGNMYDKLGIKNIGLTLAGPSGQLSQLSLKKSHQIEVIEGNIDNLGKYITESTYSDADLVESYYDTEDAYSDPEKVLADLDIIRNEFSITYGKVKPIGDHGTESYSAGLADLSSVQILANGGLITKRSLVRLFHLIISGNKIGKDLMDKPIGSGTLYQIMETLEDELKFPVSTNINIDNRDMIFDSNYINDIDNILIKYQENGYDEDIKEYILNYIKFFKEYYINTDYSIRVNDYMDAIKDNVMMIKK